MEKAIYYKMSDGGYLLLGATEGYHCSPGSYSFERVVMDGLERVGWNASCVTSKELVGAKPIMRGAMLRW